MSRVDSMGDGPKDQGVTIYLFSLEFGADGSAQIRGEHVEVLFLVNAGVEHRAVCAVDHICIVAIPVIQHRFILKDNVKLLWYNKQIHLERNKLYLFIPTRMINNALYTIIYLVSFDLS